MILILRMEDGNEITIQVMWSVCATVKVYLLEIANILLTQSSEQQ